jgi:hypothetical protein
LAKLLTSEPQSFDERFSRQPSSFLAQAILASAFQAADAIQTKYPELLEQQTLSAVTGRERKFDRVDNSGSYTLASKSAILIGTGRQKFPLRVYVLLVGSYQSCAYLLRNLHRSRSGALCQSSKITSEASRTEAATLHWSELTLRDDEFKALLVGLIQDDKPDRYPLWEVIASQLARGQPRKWKYLVMTLVYANTKALEELLRLGWNPNGGALLYFSREYIIIHNPEYLKNSHPRLYAQRQKDKVENIKLLEHHNSRHSPWLFMVFLQWYPFIAGAIYLLIIPLTAAYTFHPKCFSRSQVLGRLWTLSIIAGVVPPFIVFFVPATMFDHGRRTFISLYSFLTLMWLFHNFILPYIVFSRCVGEELYWIIIPEVFLSCVMVIMTLPV